MAHWLCATCAVEYPPAEAPPAACPICEDDRQYVLPSGQAWTTLERLAADGVRVTVEELEPDLFAVRTDPKVGIGQCGLLVRTPGGNLLWDPPGFTDAAGAAAIADLGGASFIVASHPHMYGAQVSWSELLGGAQVLVSEPDREWVQRPDARMEVFIGDREILPGVTLSTVGGHFRGSAVAHWAAGAGGRGVVLSGDAIFPGPSGEWVKFLRSYPNAIPLSPAVVDRVVDAVARRPYDRMYGNFGNLVPEDAMNRVRRSADRHNAWVRGDFDHLT